MKTSDFGPMHIREHIIIPHDNVLALIVQFYNNFGIVNLHENLHKYIRHKYIRSVTNKFLGQFPNLLTLFHPNVLETFSLEKTVV